MKLNVDIKELKKGDMKTADNAFGNIRNTLGLFRQYFINKSHIIALKIHSGSKIGDIMIIKHRKHIVLITIYKHKAARKL